MALSIGSSVPISQGYSQSGQSGQSVNSAENYSHSVNSSWSNSFNDSESHSWSGTDAATARAWSAYMADVAWARDMDAFEQQMAFNRDEAQKQRDWQAEMANTIYTRSVKNMIEAGINPILAYNMGLSGANVGTGATASLGGAPSAPLAQNFMDSWSGSESYSHGESHGGSYGEGWGEGFSNGSSWNAGWSNSEEGIVTALNALGNMAGTALDAVNAGQKLETLQQVYDNATDWGYNVGKKIHDTVSNYIEGIGDTVKSNVNTLLGNGGGGHGFKKKLKK